MIPLIRFRRKSLSIVGPLLRHDIESALQQEHRHTIRLIKSCAKHAKGASAEDMVRMILKKVEG